MKKIFLKTLISSLLLAAVANGAEDFKPNGYLQLNQTFYGNAGKYKTATSHPSPVFSYNFTEKFNVLLQWDRTWNMYNYNGSENQQNNTLSQPRILLNYDYGTLSNSKIDFSTFFQVQNQSTLDHNNQTYFYLQTAFDFSKYLPKGEYISATQFAIAPSYIYGVSEGSAQGAKGHMNNAMLAFLTNWNLPANFTFTFNAFLFREWYDGYFELPSSIGTYDSANYFMFYAWLQYSKELYKFDDKTSLAFNFTGGYDPYIFSNRKTSFDPYIVGDQMYEWLDPAVTTSESYKNTYILFALPQLELTYNYSEDISISLFAQVKYSNQVWGATEKGWRFQPQGGFTVTYNF